ncbi:hypothetical protein SIN09_09595 [Streptomyces sp. F8]|uniref:hypothetical protein n=1 Tax=Streptomyces sp. F8 TaxID=1436085 RepID=UPI0029CF387C|nr:hypothetical protein [Streptomyces sp. F8]MDX6759694.1 hypothetical protein [Streptomyces sp. F8]
MDTNTGHHPPGVGLTAPGLSDADLFAHCLTDDGLALLESLLDSGRYEVRAPEHAALLYVAWLRRAGQDAAAAELVEELRPFAAEVRFAPYPAEQPVPGPDAVHRLTVGEAAAALARRAPRPAVEAQREALTVWRPYEDELLGHWLRIEADPQAVTRAQGAALLARYRELAAAHTRCTKHLNPKSNTAILLRGLQESAAGRELPPRLAGLVRHAVASMVARRGRPGSAEHTRLRREQARQAALPAHHELAALVLRRLAPLDTARGTADVGALTGPVTAEEARSTGLPVGAGIPPSIRAPVAAAVTAPLRTLLDTGAVPSAEVLGEVAAELIAAHTAQGYADESLGALVAATYRARRPHRYALWWSREHHERIASLPWVRAVAPWGPDPAVRARATLRTFAEVCVEGFPGAGLPDLLAAALSDLAPLAGLPAPLLTEPFAAAYGARTSPGLLPAARAAGELLRGTAYERYHGIDYAQVLRLAAAADHEGFAELCVARAGRTGPSPAGDAAVVEQARILTTSNLATLVRYADVSPPGGWEGAARGAFAAAVRRSATPAQTARAWRQLLFHLSLCDADGQRRALAWIDDRAARLPARTAAGITAPLARLRRAVDQGASDGSGPDSP